jgi:hypothetical protein
MTETSPVDAKWPRWAWFVYPALAISIGGGLGYVVANAREPELQRVIHSTAKPVVAAPTITPVAAPQPDPPSPDPEIEVQPETVKAATAGPAPRTMPKPKAKPKPAKSTPCNIYDHMNGC